MHVSLIDPVSQVAFPHLQHGGRWCYAVPAGVRFAVRINAVSSTFRGDGGHSTARVEPSPASVSGSKPSIELETFGTLETFGERLHDTDPVDVVAKRPLVFVADGGTDVDAGIAGAPQRLDGRPDLTQPGDPVAAYRRWYVATKLGGGPGTWDGQASGWSRRAPPPWLDRCAPAGYEVRIDVLGPTGLVEGEPQHDTHVASLVRSAATANTKVLDSASRT